MTIPTDARIKAAVMAKTRLDRFADEANAGQVHYDARELKRKISAAFADFDEALDHTDRVAAGKVEGSEAFKRAVRQAALAIAYDFSEFTDCDPDQPTDWAGQPSIARLRSLFSDATITEAQDASMACRAWAEAQEQDAMILPFVPAPASERG